MANWAPGFLSIYRWYLINNASPCHAARNFFLRAENWNRQLLRQANMIISVCHLIKQSGCHIQHITRHQLPSDVLFDSEPLSQYFPVRQEILDALKVNKERRLRDISNQSHPPSARTTSRDASIRQVPSHPQPAAHASSQSCPWTIYVCQWQCSWTYQSQ